MDTKEGVQTPGGPSISDTSTAGLLGLTHPVSPLAPIHVLLSKVKCGIKICFIIRESGAPPAGRHPLICTLIKNRGSVGGLVLRSEVFFHGHHHSVMSQV